MISICPIIEQETSDVPVAVGASIQQSRPSIVGRMLKCRPILEQDASDLRVMA